jgi:plasmid stabilization system protein ParE
MSRDELPARPVSIRPRAIADIERHADYLEENATADVALHFRSAIREAIEQAAEVLGAKADLISLLRHH